MAEQSKSGHVFAWVIRIKRCSEGVFQGAGLFLLIQCLLMVFVVLPVLVCPGAGGYAMASEEGSDWDDWDDWDEVEEEDAFGAIMRTSFIHFIAP